MYIIGLYSTVEWRECIALKKNIFVILYYGTYSMKGAFLPCMAMVLMCCFLPERMDAEKERKTAVPHCSAACGSPNNMKSLLIPGIFNCFEGCVKKKNTGRKLYCLHGCCFAYVSV